MQGFHRFGSSPHGPSSRAFFAIRDCSACATCKIACRFQTFQLVSTHLPNIEDDSWLQSIVQDKFSIYHHFWPVGLQYTTKSTASRKCRCNCAVYACHMHAKSSWFVVEPFLWQQIKYLRSKNDSLLKTPGDANAVAWAKSDKNSWWRRESIRTPQLLTTAAIKEKGAVSTRLTRH